jgi:predicted cupin superfamily sugar epimerase
MTESPRVNSLISQLQLAPLPHEGGYFRQTWCSEHGSAILFLLTPTGFSALHRIAQDEVWLFHDGDAVEHVQLDATTREAKIIRLGKAVLAGETPQLVVPRGTWQGARLARDAQPGAGYALLSCTLAPPWDERGFELGERGALNAEFPSATTWVQMLTR